MRKLFYLFVPAFLALFLWSCGEEKSGTRPSGKDLYINWEVLENSYKGQSNFRSEFTFINKSKFDLKQDWAVYFNFCRAIIIDSANTLTGNVEIKRINGDFCSIKPTDKFYLKAGDSIKIQFTASDWAINYSDAPTGLYIVYTDSTSNKEFTPEVIANYFVKPFVNEAQYKRTAGDITPMPTAEYRFQINSATSTLPADQLLPIVPAPVSYAYGQSSANITSEYSIVADQSLSNEAAFLKSALEGVLDKPLASGGNKTITLKIGDVTYQGKKLTAGKEAYTLDIKDGNITITGSDAAGVFYGISSLRALLPVDAYKTKQASLAVREITITDFPRFGFRGMLLDVARNFQKKQAVLKLLDMMAFYKLNKFHFHLSDDEGWRVEIKDLPELTEIGGNRKHDATGKGMLPSFGSGPFGDSAVGSGSGFYSRKDFIEILQYAKARHIEVIPEIDVPGHIRSAIKAMDVRYERLMKEGKEQEANQYLIRDLKDSSVYRSVQGWNDNAMCICQEGAFNFIDKVVMEFKAMYTEAGAPFTTFHIGGDEVPEGTWQKSPLCQELLDKSPTLNTTHDLHFEFLRRMNAILTKYDLNVGGWEEIGIMKTDKGQVANPEFAKNRFRPNIWNNVWGWGTEDNAYKLANAGYKIVLSNVTHLYFDLAYSKDPAEPGYYWGAFINTRKPFEFIPYNFFLSATEDRMGNTLNPKEVAKGKVMLTAEGRNNILGIQGQLWSENTTSNQVMEYQIFPKFLALAQRAWSPDPAWSTELNDQKRAQMIQQDWTVFANTLGQRELKRMDYIFGGIGYALPVPGAIVQNGKVTANVEFPGLTIRYTTDGSEPTEKSPVYTAPFDAAPGTTVKLQTFSSKGRASRTSVLKVQ